MTAVVIASVIGGACGSLAAIGVSGLALAAWQSRRSDRWRR